MKVSEILTKTYEKFEPIYKRVRPGYIGIILGLIGYITIIIAMSLYHLVEPINFFSHWTSNLGAPVTFSGLPTNGSNIVFIIGLCSMSVLGFIFIVYLSIEMNEEEQKYIWLINIAAIFGLISVIGSFGVAIFDMMSIVIVHAIFAFLFFLGSCLSMLIFSVSMFFNLKISRKQAIFGIIIAGIGVAFFLSLVPFIHFLGEPFTIEMAGCPELTLTRFLEWIYLLGVFFWFIVTGVYFLKDREER